METGLSLSEIISICAALWNNSDQQQHRPLSKPATAAVCVCVCWLGHHCAVARVLCAVARCFRPVSVVFGSVDEADITV